MNFTIKLPLPIPSKKNSKQIFVNKATGKPFVTSSASHKAWWANTIMLVKAEKQRQLDYFTFNGCSIIITFCDNGKREYDLTNKAESIMDILVDAGIIADDNRFVVPDLHLKYEYSDKKECAIEIEGI
jgi:Holliday junction resolvase RusA-like endonuclease